MKRSLAVLFTMLVLCAALASQAATVFTLQVTTLQPTITDDWTVIGNVTTANDVFFSRLNPAPTFTNVEPSIVPYGDATSNQFFGPPPDPDSFNKGILNKTAANFQFMLDAGPAISGTAHTFNVYGFITGDLQLSPQPRSGSVWNVDHVVDLTTGLSYSLIDTSPVGATALHINADIAGLPFQIWVDAFRTIPAPTNAPLGLGGFVAVVPEPGAIALLIGFGVSGSAFFLRRRKA
jgi:hypothetical protein